MADRTFFHWIKMGLRALVSAFTDIIDNDLFVPLIQDSVPLYGSAAGPAGDIGPGAGQPASDKQADQIENPVPGNGND